jgi:hypothetical protein
MSTDSIPDWRRGPGPEMIPTAGPPGGRPFTRQPHQHLPPPPYMYASYQPQHQVSNCHNINTLRQEVSLKWYLKNQFLHHRKHYICITNASKLFREVITVFCKSYTGYTQKNGAVSKVNKKFISHLTWAQRTPSAAATVQVSHALITVLQCVHPESHDTHPHGNQIHPRLGVACPL